MDEEHCRSWSSELSSSSLSQSSEQAPVAKASNNHHPKKVNVQKCGECKKNFASARILREHERLHTSLNLYKCPVPHCDRQFKWRSSMSAHKRSHEFQALVREKGITGNGKKPQAKKRARKAVKPVEGCVTPMMSETMDLWQPSLDGISGPLSLNGIFTIPDAVEHSPMSYTEMSTALDEEAYGLVFEQPSVNWIDKILSGIPE
ncbi:hypothetical protein NDN08_008137 [Rhodosorus marinus]|uniref:C2H2-type domain-containing protein n=1 Tax=Rhodosorus marinus TaxID=101924 RepID=A0AAV8UZI8_9RHOD|nr:hypothetical protein NDN08_008137 [Rhodosorus marinus]